VSLTISLVSVLHSLGLCIYHTHVPELAQLSLLFPLYISLSSTCAWWCEVSEKEEAEEEGGGQ
jgi:hypothetical protein